MSIAAFFAAALLGCKQVLVRDVPADLVFPPAPDPARLVYERTIRGTADVAKVMISQFRQLITGENAVFNIAFQKPSSVAVHRGRIYMSDTALNAVYALDVPSGAVWQVGEGLLRKPLGLDTDSRGNLYVCDMGTRTVYAFDKKGKLIQKFGSEKEFDRPSGIAVSRDGSRVFVVDVGGVNSSNHRIRVYDGETSEFLFDIGRRGREPGQFNLPRDARVDGNGLLYVVDGGNFRVQVFDSEGQLLKVFGSIGRQSGQFARPKGIALDSEGRIYVSDAAFGNFQVFTNDGQLLLHVGHRAADEQAAHYMLPAGIAVDEDGRVYVTDQYFGKIDVFRPADLPASHGYLAQ